MIRRGLLNRRLSTKEYVEDKVLAGGRNDS